MQYIQLSNRNLDEIAYTVVKFDEKHLLPCAIKCDHLTIQVFSTLGNVHNEICRFRRRPYRPPPASGVPPVTDDRSWRCQLRQMLWR